MEISNFIDEGERHAELYGDFTPRQRYLMEIVDELYTEQKDFDSMQANLGGFGISDVELHWLKRTGRLV